MSIKNFLLKMKVASIVGNDKLSIDDRISRLLDMREVEDEDDDYRVPKYPTRNVIIYDALIRMLEKEDHKELAFAYALLAEAYAECYKERPIGPLAIKVLDELEKNNPDISLENQAMILNRLSKALENTYYLYIELDTLTKLFDIVLKHNIEIEGLDHAAQRYIRAYTLAKDRKGLPKEIPADIRRRVSDKRLMEIVGRPDKGHLKHDPVEYTREWAEAAYNVEEELDKKFAGVRRGMGFCFMYWPAKQELLKKKYGIKWRTPSQMNPRVKFD